MIMKVLHSDDDDVDNAMMMIIVTTMFVMIKMVPFIMKVLYI